MIHFIADTHFGHEEIIQFGGRPFRSAEEMDDVLIANWNDAVGDSDEVFVLGDFCWRPERAAEILGQLKGVKHLVRGNHDQTFGEGAEGFANTHRVFCAAVEHVNYTPIPAMEVVRRVEKRLLDFYMGAA